MKLRVFFIKRKVIINTIIVLAVTIVSVIYTETIATGAFGRFLNNEKVMPIYSVEVPDKRIALTFDVAWGDQYIQNIIDALKRYNVKATFFIVGAWADKYPELIESINNDNHELGNHSLNHMKMTGLSKKEIISEIKETEAKLVEAAGKKIKLFRAPFGEYDNMLVSTAKDMNYSIIQYDIDSLDWEGLSEQDVSNRVITKAGNGSIVLFHSNISYTPDSICHIIEKLRKDGYKFVTISELLLKENYYIDDTGRQRLLK